MNILGLLVIEIIGAALFSVAFIGGIQKVNTYSHIEALESLVIRVLQIFWSVTKSLAIFLSP